MPKKPLPPTHKKPASPNPSGAVGVLLILLPIGVIFLWICLFLNLNAWSTLLPPCPLYTFTGLKCPGCGNTRSVLALLRLDLVTALKNNITPPIAGFLAVAFYVELIFIRLKKDVKLLPRNKYFWIGLGIFLLLYYCLRNF